MALTDIQARTAKPGAKPCKLSDGGWLFLLVKPKSFFRLAHARTKRDEAKALLVAGIGPGEQKKADKIATAATQTNTLEQIAAELLEKKRREGKAEATLGKFEWLLSLVSPAIRARQIDGLTPQPAGPVVRVEPNTVDQADSVWLASKSTWCGCPH